LSGCPAVISRSRADSTSTFPVMGICGISVGNSRPVLTVKLRTSCKASVNWLCAAALSQERYPLSWANELCMVLAFAAMHITQSCIQTFQPDVWLQTILQSLTFGQRLFDFVQCFTTGVPVATCIIHSSASGMWLTIKKPNIRLRV